MTVTNDEYDDQPKQAKPLTKAQEYQQIANDINTFNQLAMFCGMATVGHQVPTVQLTLGNAHRTQLFISAAFLLPTLSQIAATLQARLEQNEIDTEQLLLDVAESIKILTNKNGG